MKLTTKEWVQILILAVAGATAWTTLRLSLSNTEADVASLREQLRQVRQDYLRRDVDTQHDAIFDTQITDLKERMNRLEDQK